VKGDSIQLMASHVIEGEGQRSERLAAACGNVERKRAGVRVGALANMRKHLGAQIVHGGVGCSRALVGDVTAEPRDQVIDDLRQTRPCPIDGPFLGLRVERLRVAKIGVDQAGENHPSEKAELKQLCVSFLSPTEFRDRQRRIVQGDFLAPNRGQGFEFSEETLVEIANAVRETRVVPGNAVGDELAHHRRLRAPGRIFQNLARPGRRVIDARAATKSILETLGIFAEVMQNAREDGGASGSEFFASHAGKLPDGSQMRSQALPSGRIDAFDRMRKIRPKRHG
jgi:hypothetical protein